MVLTLFLVLLLQLVVEAVVLMTLVLAQGAQAVLVVAVQQLVLVEAQQVLAQAVKVLLAVRDLAHHHLQVAQVAVLALLE
jgi:hypothetical protein